MEHGIMARREEPATVAISVRLPARLRARLDYMAKLGKRSRSEVTTDAIEAYLVLRMPQRRALKNE